MNSSEPKIFGYTWDKIKSAQQGERLMEAIMGEPTEPKATEKDYALLNEHGLEGLQTKELYGVLDRLGLPFKT